MVKYLKEILNWMAENIEKASQFVGSRSWVYMIDGYTVYPNISPKKHKELMDEIITSSYQNTHQNVQASFAGLQAYLQRVSQFPLLKPEEEIELSQRVQRWIQLEKRLEKQESSLEQRELRQEELKIIFLGEEAKKMMIEANLYLVVVIASFYQKTGLEFDLIREGTIGLKRAVKTFDITKGSEFSTYAHWWIRREIIQAIANQGRTICVPIHIQEKIRKLKKLRKQISKEKGRPATIQELTIELRKTPKQVRQLLISNYHTTSFNVLAGNEKDISSENLLESPEIEPEEKLLLDSVNFKEIMAQQFNIVVSDQITM